jgi:hypothetical protein
VVGFTDSELLCFKKEMGCRSNGSFWCIVQIVGTGARDGEAKVRGQAMFALGELAGNCQPEMSAHAREALPCVFAAMAEDNPTLQQQACYALDSFCEHLGAPPAHCTCSLPQGG